MNSAPHIHQINVSRGGVPKLPVAKAVLTASGITGDVQRDLRYHGGVMRAVCLFALEIIERVRGEGHPIAPGSSGENITTVGLEWSSLVPGTRLQLGDEVMLEITSYTVPCKTIAASFAGGEFKRISQKLYPGESRLYACVLSEGRIKTGDAIHLLQ